MSKSEVNICKKFHISKLKSETALPSSLKSSIHKGKYLNYQRCQNGNESFEGAKFKPKKVKPTNFYVCRLAFPPENEYPSCDHQNDFIVDRSTFTRDEYTKFLAAPKKFYEKPHPQWVRRNIPACTAHLNELSQPKKLNLISTLSEHRHHFPFNRIESLMQRIHFGDRRTPQEVMQSLKQQLRDSKHKIKHQKCEIRRLKMKITKSKQFENLSAQLVSKLRQSILCDRPMNITENTEKLADLILPKICEITGHKIPNKCSTNMTDKAHIKLARNFAVVVYDNLRNNCLKNNLDIQDKSECMKRFQQLCFPIESYYPKELPKVVSTIDTTERDQEEEDSLKSHDDEEEVFDDEILEATSQEVTEKLSFLSQSQINVPLEECQTLDKALGGMVEQLAAKKAEKDQMKAERAEKEKAIAQARAQAEAERLAAERAARRARRRKGKGNCFGNLNPKPRWQVEWTETETNDLCKPSTSNSP